MPMTSDRERLEKEWQVLYENLLSYLSRFGEDNAFGAGDFWVRDDQWGAIEQVVFVFNLDLFTAPIVSDIQRMLADFPDWTVLLVVDVVGKEKEWPRMGITVRRDEIIDDLRREYLPERLQQLRF
jgi:hypothetical protein